MNIALTAVILAVILLPGAAFLWGYYTSLKERNAAIHIPFMDSLFRGLIISLLIHSTSICVIRLCGYDIFLKQLYSVLTTKDLPITDNEFVTAFLQFCSYSGILTFASFTVAKFLKRCIQRKNWDLTYYSLRNTNYFFQLFSARYLDYTGVQGEREGTDMIFLDVYGKNDVLYSGILVDFYFRPELEKLETLVLQNARKRKLFVVNDSNNEIKAGPVSHIPNRALCCAGRLCSVSSQLKPN